MPLFMKSRPVILWLALVLICCHSASALPPIRVLAWDDQIAGRKLALATSTQAVEITGLHPSKRGRPIKLAGAEEALFIRALDKPPVDGKPVQRGCTISSSVRYPLVVLLPDPSDLTGVRTMIIDDDPAGFAWGSYRFLNATSQEIGIYLEKTTRQLPVGWKPVDLLLGGETRGIPVIFGTVGEGAKPIYSAVWEFDPNIRTLCFLVPSTDPGQSPVLVKAIPEDRKAVVPVPPEAGAGAGGR